MSTTPCHPSLPIDIQMCESLHVTPVQQSVARANDHMELDLDDRCLFEELLPQSILLNGTMPSKFDTIQKSMISVYDNNPHQQIYYPHQSEIETEHRPLVGIIGRSKRSRAFTRRLLSSGFPMPILCDVDSNGNNHDNELNYVSNQEFYQLSPSIILITDNVNTNLNDVFPQHKEQLIIDARQTPIKYFPKKLANSLSPIPGSCRAFGNLSNWEIEHGTQRIGVAIEQVSSLDLLKFIYDLKCFTRGIFFLDQYSYNKQEIRSFHNCLFPFISTLIIFSSCFIFSMIEHYRDTYKPVLIYRQASSITAATSTILLAFLLILRPMLKLIEFVSLIIFQEQNEYENAKSQLTIMQYWSQSRCYLVWYSLSFSLLHLIFIIFSKMEFNLTLFTYGFFFGIFTLILLIILSYAHLPWISERLLWSEYNLLTNFIGPVCLLITFVHVFLMWKLNSNLFNLRFLSMILLLIALFVRFIIYAIVYPSIKFMKYLADRSLKSSV